METYTIINSNYDRLVIEDQTVEGNNEIFNTISELILCRANFTVRFVGEEEKNEPKTFAELIHDIKMEQQADSTYALRIEIASAVLGNISLKEMTNEQIDALCQRIANNLFEYDDDCPDIYEVAYRIQKLLDDGEYDEPNDECVAQAFEDSRQ